MTGLFAAILDGKGNTLAAAGCQDLCSLFHHRHTGRCEHQQEEDSSSTNHSPDPDEEFIEFTCTHGLRHLSAPLLIDGTCVATILTGRFFYDDDKKCYLNALNRIPVFSEKE